MNFVVVSVYFAFKLFLIGFVNRFFFFKIEANIINNYSLKSR